MTPPCPENWESCDYCGAGPSETCRNPDVRPIATRSGPIPPRGLSPERGAPGSCKDTNPKEAVGVRKPALSVLPFTVIAECGVALTEGARKYGRHNYREMGVRASTYFDATQRHLMAWWEGEDIDPDSGLSHVTKAITSLMVLRDAEIQRMCTDDRPPKAPAGWLSALQAAVDGIFERHPTSLPAYTAQVTEPSTAC
jgi:hypothetical protein